MGIDTTNKPKNKIKISICKNEDLQFYSSIKRYLLEFRNNNKLLIKLINSLNKEEETKIAKILCHFFFEDITQNECSPIFIKFIKNLIQNGFKNLDLNISDSFFEKHTFLSKIFDEIIYRKEIKLYTKHILTDIIKLLKKEEEKLIKNTFSKNDLDFLKGLKKEMKEKLDFYNELEIFFSSGRYMEINPKGINKGYAIKWLCDYLNIDIKDSIAIGDNYNDIPMIQAAGLGCCVASAEDDVKKISDYVCEKDYSHGAVAEVIEKFILNPSENK